MVPEEDYGMLGYFVFLKWFQMSAIIFAYENAAYVCIIFALIEDCFLCTNKKFFFRMYSVFENT